LCAASDEQYESISDDEIALLVRKFRTLHRFCKERRRPPRGCFECGDTTHFIADCPKIKKFDSSNKYNYNNRNDSSYKGEGKKYRFGDNNKKKFQKMMSRACATLSDLDFSSDDSSSSEEDERPKRKTGDFTGLCLMGKSSRHISDSDSNVMDEGLEDTWLMDSGCSRHMTKNKKWFSSLTPLSHKECVTFEDDKKGKVLGTSVIKVNDCFTLNDVTLVDRLRYILLSISQLCDADLSVLFRKSDSHVLDSSGKRVCGISYIGNIFQADFSSSQSSLRCLISQSSSKL
jgi:hypothetical protein